MILLLLTPALAVCRTYDHIFYLIPHPHPHPHPPDFFLSWRGLSVTGEEIFWRAVIWDMRKRLARTFGEQESQCLHGKMVISIQWDWMKSHVWVARTHRKCSGNVKLKSLHLEGHAHHWLHLSPHREEALVLNILLPAETWRLISCRWNSPKESRNPPLVLQAIYSSASQP